MNVVVDGLLTQYQKTGKGKMILLLHGWGDSAKGLEPLARSLGDHYQVIVPDLPGFGGSQAPPAAWGLNEYAAFIANFLKKIDTKDLYAIVAHSNGGTIAIRGLANAEWDAERLVLLASAGIRGTYKGRVKAIRYVVKVGKALTLPLPASVKRRLRQKVYKTVGSDMLVAEHLQNSFKKIVTDDVRSDAAQLTLPTLLIYGEKDDAAPVWYGETFHELIANSTLEVLPGAGHFVHVDRAHEVTKAIKGFLQ